MEQEEDIIEEMIRTLPKEKGLIKMLLKTLSIRLDYLNISKKNIVNPTNQARS